MQDFGVCGSEGGLAKLKIGKFWQIFDKMKVCVVGSQPPPTSHLQPVVNFSQRHSLTNHFEAIIVRNSGKSIVPFPSASTSLIMSWSSASVGFCPRDLITVPNSLVVIVPSPSLSNKENASLNSAICSSVSWSAIFGF